MMGLDAGRAAGGAFGSKDVVPVDERTRDCGEGGTTSGLPETYPAPKTWCSLTKEQGFAGREAPRPARIGPLRFGKRGARRRKSKVLRGVKHHVRLASGLSGSENVVPVDERARDCGEGPPPTGSPAAPLAPKTWCSSTKEQGIAGREAPRPARRPVPEKAPELGARGTEEQGFARNRAPRPRRPAPASQSPRAGRPKK